MHKRPKTEENGVAEITKCEIKNAYNISTHHHTILFARATNVFCVLKDTLHTTFSLSLFERFRAREREREEMGDATTRRESKNALHTHVLLFLSQVNWMGMHIVFAVALRQKTKAMVLSFYRESLACVLLTAFCAHARRRRRRKRGNEKNEEEEEEEEEKEEERGGRGGDGEGTTTTTTAAVARGVTNAETKKNTDEDDDVTETTTKVTSTQTIIVVSIVLGAILALIRASVVLANANAGPDVTSALVLTTPVLTFFFSAMFRIEHFSFREVNREHPENVMKVLAILSVSVSVAVVCSYRGALMFGDPKEYEAPNVLVGAIWMLTNTLASSVAIVMQKMIINANIPIEIVNAAMTGIGAFWLLIVGFIAHGTSKDVWTLSSDGLYAVLFGAFFPSAMNLIIFAKSSKILGPNITARYFLLQPAMTWVLDYVVLKDAVYESYVICAFFSAMAMMLFASANSFVRKPKEEEREQQV